MHLHASRREHSRGLVREKREEMVVDVKEGTARLKCAVAVLAVDLASGKAVLELKSNASTADGGGGTTCRFCAAVLLGDRIVPGHDACCSDPDCLDLDARACTEKLGCGHLCGGVVGEAPEARLVSLEAFEPWPTHLCLVYLEVASRCPLPRRFARADSPDCPVIAVPPVSALRRERVLRRRRLLPDLLHRQPWIGAGHQGLPFLVLLLPPPVLQPAMVMQLLARHRLHKRAEAD
jgi:hypothetical protein